MLKRVYATAVIVVLASVAPAMAEINKCTGADGRVVFSDQPCTAGQKAAVIRPQVSPGPAATQTQREKFYDRAAEQAAKKLEDPQFKEECRVASQRQAELSKDKTGQTAAAEVAAIKQRVDDCQRRLQEYLGIEFARLEYLNKQKAERAIEQAAADEPKRRQRETDCKKLEGEILELRINFKGNSPRNSSGLSQDESDAYQYKMRQLRKEMRVRECPPPSADN
jgi:Domain of unknown function (DUF4124)